MKVRTVAAVCGWVSEQPGVLHPVTHYGYVRAMCGWVLQATAVEGKLFLKVHPAGG